MQANTCHFGNVAIERMRRVEMIYVCARWRTQPLPIPVTRHLAYKHVFTRILIDISIPREPLFISVVKDRDAPRKEDHGMCKAHAAHNLFAWRIRSLPTHIVREAEDVVITG